MADLTVTTGDDAVVVAGEYWRLEHRRRSGGAWASLRFRHGTRRNLLARPAGSYVKLCRVLPGGGEEAVAFPTFAEWLDPHARLRVQEGPEGPIVTAEGTYTAPDGATLPLEFRHRYEYRSHGLVAHQVELLPRGRCEGLVEVCALDLRLRKGLTHAYVRQHPIPNPNADLRGGVEWLDLVGGGRYRSRYVPVHVVAFERLAEGLELFPTSDLAQWDSQLKSDVGLGMYAVGPGNDGTTAVGLSPYCLAFRRVGLTLDRPVRFDWYAGVPSVKDRAATGSSGFHASLNSHWATDAQLADLAAAGVRLLRFHNDYREDGPFWRDGAYPPYDAEGMAHLRRLVETAHALGMKIVPYVSLKEFHPEAPGYARHAQDWAQMPAPSAGDIHTWIGSGQFGRMECLASGWLDRRKADVDAILADLPWDGLYFDWTKPLPCRNPSHRGGALHTDTDEYLDFMRYCRRRVGPGGILFSHLSGFPYLVTENLSDLVPIVARHLATSARGGTVDARRLIMGGILQGHPAPLHAPAPAGSFAAEMLQEARLFENADLRAFRFTRAADGPVDTGRPHVYAALWRRPGGAMVYVGNFSARPARGTLRLPAAALRALGGKAADCRVLRPGGTPLQRRLTAAQLRKGLGYRLGAWASALYRLQR